ncbi:interleukin-18 receptor 1-like [Anableps anableps]
MAVAATWSGDASQKQALEGVCPMAAKEIYVNAGDLVMLQCEDCKHDGTVMLWKMETDLKRQLYSNVSASEQQQLGLVLYQNSLVILSASLNHQGNYSCSPLRNTRYQMRFRLRVYSELSKEFKFRNRYNQTCYTNQACTLNCPEENIPNSTRTGTATWHKENGELSKHYFPSVGLEKSGVYICTWSFLYSGQIYNTSFTVVLDIQTGKLLTNLGIYSPKNGQVFEVELGKTAVITCTAAIDAGDSSLFWLRKHEFVEKNDTLRYFYNDTYSNNTSLDDVYWMNATLVFREVLEEDLSTNFSCKLESAELTLFVTIDLNKTAGPSYFILTVCTVCIVVVMAVIAVTYVKFKIGITLFLRDELGFKGCQSNTSDGKSYDAFLMCYKSDTDGGLSEEDRKCLASTLEDQFGYSLCLYDRDVLPGQAVAEAILDCIEHSRAVVLIPSFPDPEPGSGVLSAIHASLVERKTRLIFINTEQTEASRSGSFPEALQLLSKAGNSVTWKERPPSSSFWKQLRYHLPAPQQTPKMQLLPQEC